MQENSKLQIQCEDKSLNSNGQCYFFTIFQMKPSATSKKRT